MKNEIILVCGIVALLQLWQIINVYLISKNIQKIREIIEQKIEE